MGSRVSVVAPQLEACSSVVATTQDRLRRSRALDHHARALVSSAGECLAVSRALLRRIDGAEIGGVFVGLAPDGVGTRPASPPETAARSVVG
jgi:hypothetical protein